MPSFFNGKIIFIHIPKCAGKSVRSALMNYQINKRPDLQDNIELYRWHESLIELQQVHGNDINNSCIISTIRHPAERAVSWWKYLKKANKIIGDRSYSTDPTKVTAIGKFLLKLYKKKKIGTVTKHIPGHGSSKKDTHHKISFINSSKAKLIRRDFKPFKLCQSHFAMTAHLIYRAYDSTSNATQSKIIIKEVIREHIGFKGILISDDISMKALKFGLIKNAIMALNAGCNLILHCNANISEMKKLVKIVPTIDKFTQKKTSQFYKFLG